MIALLLPAVQAAREAARRAACANNLKQIGLAVHNFHDTMSGLPPGAIGINGGAPSNYVGFWVLIMPYMEQPMLYERYSAGVSGSGTGVQYFFSSNTWQDIVDNAPELRKELASFGGYRCPSRRGGGEQASTLMKDVSGFEDNNYDTDAWRSAMGPSSDFAFVISTSGSDWYWIHSQDPNDANDHLHNHRGPFRLAFLPPPWGMYNPHEWQVRDTMAWWSDGTSNQLIVGEKHIYEGSLGKCAAAWSAPAWEFSGDCTYLTAGAWHTGAGRPIVQGDDIETADIFPIRRKSEVAADYARTYFGSWHPGICQFLLGDGAVRAIPVTISLNTYASLGHVNDGRTVAVP